MSQNNIGSLYLYKTCHLVYEVYLPVKAAHLRHKVYLPVKTGHVGRTVYVPVKIGHLVCEVYVPVKTGHLVCESILILSSSILVSWHTKIQGQRDGESRWLVPAFVKFDELPRERSGKRAATARQLSASRQKRTCGGGV